MKQMTKTKIQWEQPLESMILSVNTLNKWIIRNLQIQNVHPTVCSKLAHDLGQYPYLYDLYPLKLGHLFHLQSTETVAVMLCKLQKGKGSSYIYPTMSITTIFLILTDADSTETIPWRFNRSLTLTLYFSLWEVWKGPICNPLNKGLSRNIVACNTKSTN